MKKMIVSPSVLSADLADLGNECRRLRDSGADWIHCDVMDGSFVPNITFGMPVIKDMRKYVDIPLDVHLMIDKPERYISQFADAGADLITVHLEACTNVRATLRLIRDCGCKAGLSVKPATSLQYIEQYKDCLDMLLIMSVEPGFGGQKFMEQTYRRLREARKIVGDKVLLQVDGGVNLTNAPLLGEAGADVLVAGSAVFNATDMSEAIRKLKG